MVETEVHTSLPKPSSLLLKRSAHPLHKAPPNLTIMTPSYGAADQTSIHSAPLHPRGHKHNPVTATHPKHRVNRVQQFMQPFEMLYDNIEHTRSLKSTLDDHIRRSSTLIQSLQSSSTMIETLVRKHVRESMHQQLQECCDRIEFLERRILASSSSSPPPKEKQLQEEENGHYIRAILSELVDRLDRLESKMNTGP
ncbi:hypothetical protein BX666DRAFT_1854097 [Dichotomocladium elegans]|nr:hypothetical protein BX666DRAFT_1854097 [Dichotomocladium elegans]